MTKKIQFLFVLGLVLATLTACDSPEVVVDYTYGCDFVFEIADESGADSSVKLYTAVSMNGSDWNCLPDAFGAICVEKLLEKDGNAELSTMTAFDGVSNGVYISFVLKIDDEYFTGFDKNDSFYLDVSDKGDAPLFAASEVRSDNIYVVKTEPNSNENGTLYSSKKAGESEFSRCPYEEASKRFSVKLKSDGVEINIKQ